MDTIESVQDILMNSYNRLFGTVAEFIPAIIGAIVLLLIGWLVAWAVKAAVKKILVWSHFSQLVNKLKIPELLSRVNIKTHPDEFIAVVSYWGVFLIFVIAAFDVLGMDAVVETMNDLVAYLPNIIIAAIIAVLTLMVGQWLRGVVESFSEDLPVDTTLAGVVAEVAIVIFGGVIVLSQLGLDMTIVTANITVIVASLAISGAALMAYSGRHVMSNILSGLMSTDYVDEGKTISVHGMTGTVKQVKRTGVILTTADGDQFIPHDVIQKSGSLTHHGK